MSYRTTTFWARILRNELRFISSKPPSSTAGTAKEPLFRHPFPSHSVLTPRFFSTGSSKRTSPEERIIEKLFEVGRDKQWEKEDRIKKGLDTADIDAEENEDFMGAGPLIEKLEKKKLKEEKVGFFDEPTDSDSEDDDERWTPDAINKRWEVFDKKFKLHEELLKNFTDAETLDDAYKWMNRIDKFEQKHFRLRPEYRVIGELMNRLKVSEGKEKFLLQQKINRALRMVQWREAYDPNDPENYGTIQHEQVGPSVDLLEHAGFEKEDGVIEGADDDNDDDIEFDDMKEKDDILLEKLNAIDRKLEEKLAELDHTFGKKGKLLEEEIRDLAEERNSLTEKKRRPLYRKGFDVKLINVNRTCKVTKGGQVVKYTALLACGNYHGVVGFAKAKGPAIPIALQKAYEKCFQNLHYVERHEEHTISHAVQTHYKKTKVYLWPAPTQTGMKAGRTVQTILHLAGFRNVKSKVVGSRNPHNTVKALFKALNAIETPKDVEEKFGRTVVESYLL